MFNEDLFLDNNDDQQSSEFLTASQIHVFVKEALKKLED